MVYYSYSFGLWNYHQWNDVSLRVDVVTQRLKSKKDVLNQRIFMTLLKLILMVLQIVKLIKSWS